MITTALIHLYPRAWRQRYGSEMKELLASQGLSLRTIADLVAGAIDARVAPQRGDQEPVVSEGAVQMIKRTLCNPGGLSKEDQWRSAAWMIGGSLVLCAVAILLQLTIGENSLSQGLLYSAFPAALALSNECTYFKRYSNAARTTMALGSALFVIAITWAAVVIGKAI